MWRSVQFLKRPDWLLTWSWHRDLSDRVDVQVSHFHMLIPGQVTKPRVPWSSSKEWVSGDVDPCVFGRGGLELHETAGLLYSD
jgi:hypothetical protein